VFRRWAEARIYRRTMQLAVAELRRAARTASALEKLHCLEVAEQKLRDALWLRPERGGEQFEGGLAEIQRSRERTLREQALPAVERLLEVAGALATDRDPMLQAAGELLCFLHHYLPDDPKRPLLSARLRELGGTQPAYQPVTPLSEIYRRPEGGVGCAALIGGLLVVLLLSCLAFCWLAR